MKTRGFLLVGLLACVANVSALQVTEQFSSVLTIDGADANISPYMNLAGWEFDRTGQGQFSYKDGLSAPEFSGGIIRSEAGARTGTIAFTAPVTDLTLQIILITPQYETWTATGFDALGNQVGFFSQILDPASSRTRHTKALFDGQTISSIVLTATSDFAIDMVKFDIHLAPEVERELTIPDGGATLGLLALGVIGLSLFRESLRCL